MTHVLDNYIELVLDKYDAYFTSPKFSFFCSWEHWNNTSQGGPDNIKNLSASEKDLLCSLCQWSRQLKAGGNSIFPFQGEAASVLKKEDFGWTGGKTFLTWDLRMWKFLEGKVVGMSPELLVTSLDPLASALRGQFFTNSQHKLRWIRTGA